MLVGMPRVATDGTKTRVSASVTTADPRLAHLSELWWDTDAGVTLSDRGDAFLAGLLPIASAIGEDLELQGRVSPQLLYGMRERQKIHRTWWPELAQAEIRCELDEPREEESGRGAALLFSGGVDSFYTLGRHLAEPIPRYRFTHAVTINGFDLDRDPEETGFAPAFRAIYGPMFEELGIRSLLLRTNLAEFRRAILIQGLFSKHVVASLQAAALVLAPEIRVFTIATGAHYGGLLPDGEHPLTDVLASTERLQIVSDGGEAARSEKTEAVAAMPMSWSRLRVCSNVNWKNIDAAQKRVSNCGRCDKCVLTQIALDAVGALPKYTTFPPVERRLYWTMKYSNQWWPWFALDNLQLLARKKRIDLAVPLRGALALYRLRQLVTFVFRRLLRVKRASVVTRVAPPASSRRRPSTAGPATAHSRVDL